MLTGFQKQVMRALAANRSPNSVAVGGAVLNRATPRISRDIDFAAWSRESVASSFHADRETLRRAGYAVEETERSRPDEGFAAAFVSKDGQSLLLDWTWDSAVRFFPAIPDPDFGWRLHDADLAVNKVLALAGRREARDYVDVVDLHRRGLPLSALAWAAPGKDPGFTPELVLDEMTRNAVTAREELERAVAGAAVDPVALKRDFLHAVREARELFARLPPDHAGCLYVDAAGKIHAPDPAATAAGRLALHGVSVGGAWPEMLRVPLRLDPASGEGAMRTAAAAFGDAGLFARHEATMEARAAVRGNTVAAKRVIGELDAGLRALAAEMKRRGLQPPRPTRSPGARTRSSGERGRRGR